MKYKLRTEPIGRLRRTNTKSLILACLVVGVLVSLLSAPAQASQPSPLDRGRLPADTFSILLEGPYKQVPLGHGPDLGLATVDLSDDRVQCLHSTPEVSAAGAGPHWV